MLINCQKKTFRNLLKFIFGELFKKIWISNLFLPLNNASDRGVSSIIIFDILINLKYKNIIFYIFFNNYFLTDKIFKNIIFL